jgi:hypothetical protein
MVVIGEVIVIVVMAVPVLAMPIVAVPIVPVPCRAAMPAATAPSTGTGDVSATYSASAKVAGAHVPSGEMCSAAYVAHASAHVAHAAAPMASGIRLIHQDWFKQQAACNGSDCGYMLSHDCISLDTQTAWSRPPTLMPSLTLMRGGSLRSVASPQ